MRDQRGQVIVLLAWGMVALITIVGLAIDGSYAYVQRRSAQNATDLASLAGANQIALALGGPTVLHDCDVRKSIDRVLAANGGQPIPRATYGTAAGPHYISGAASIVQPISYDDACSAPIPTATAVGVQVGATRQWHTFFLGLIGQSEWTASAVSNARTGYLASPPEGSLFPVALACANFVRSPDNGALPCESPPGTAGLLDMCPAGQTAIECGPVQLTDETNNMPGGKGWLGFGAGQHCSGSGLGQDPTYKCGPSQPELQIEIGHGGGADDPTPGESHGCCSAVGQQGSADTIGSLSGLKGKSLTCDWFIGQTPPRVVVVPIYDSFGGQGQSSGFYHIVGFAGFEVTSCNNGFSGVWRTAVFGGPTLQTPTPGALKLMSVQLVK
jgi:hypothetical protein